MSATIKYSVRVNAPRAGIHEAYLTCRGRDRWTYRTACKQAQDYMRRFPVVTSAEVVTADCLTPVKKFLR